MEIVNLYPGSFGANCYCLFDGGEAVVIDPSANADVILAEIQKRDAILRYILLTHGHFDHILSLDELRNASNTPACIHEKDAEMLTDSYKNAFRYFFGNERTWQVADRTLCDGEELTFGATTVKVIHTPGHSKGSVCYLVGNEFLFTGDTLFDGNVGRSDLYGGNGATLMQSLQKLRTLPQALPIYPGHGGTALLGGALDVFLY